MVAPHRSAERDAIGGWGGHSGRRPLAWAGWPRSAGRASGSWLLRYRIGVELGADGVGEVVVATAVGVDRPEHGADHAGVAGGLAQLVPGSGGSLAGDDVVHRLTDDGGRCVSGEEADGNLAGRHRWEELLGIASHVEAVQQEFCHGGVIVHGAGLIDLAIETFKRWRIVTLHINEGEDVADGIR